ncbi:MAG TPA: MBL fold metallo-hydrolase, partial [Planctomycetota bacterium]|nr:MBL fold metallo-hydrolase [Planctomycetota bacterium]
LAFAGGSREARGVRFESCLVHENDRGEGPNAMVKLRLDDITVAHQGDLGHALTGEALEFLRDADVLLALAGGPPTIALGDLVAAIDSLRPAIVIPMHFKTPRVNLNILPVESFLEEARSFPVDRPGASSLKITRALLPRETRIVLLEHAR